MYSIEELKELIAAVDNSGITQFKIKSENGDKLFISKKASVVSAECALPPVQTTSLQISDTAAQAAAEPKLSGKTINSPMVGVFYSSASPESDNYVEVGKQVKKGDTVCIVEAMKLMNEITATESGTIEEVLVENGQIVEFGQPLFRLS